MSISVSPDATLRDLWQQLYGSQADELLAEFVGELKQARREIPPESSAPDWYRDAVVYSLYVDLFNATFDGLRDKLDYLQRLGVSCLWLLPILDSPMKDAGFDIRRYDRIRPELLGLPEDAEQEKLLGLFREFMTAAHERGIRVIFDVALNHTSVEHEWFRQASSAPDSPYRDYYIWNDDDRRYAEARIIFKGLCSSNWEQLGDQYYFHRFFEIQPDLNYRNPRVLVEVCRVLLFWLRQGADGFRLDAIPYIWKEDGTNCENLPQAHTIIRFIRAMLDSLRPGTLMLAEACQPPIETVKYFGDGDECHAGYHFPLMPRIFRALAEQRRDPIVQTLDPAFTPPIPESCQWFTFLRCHDELTLEMVTPEERQALHTRYCRDPRWDFRQGEGISARLAELLENDPRRIALANSIMLSLGGTPIIFYGDEVAKGQDQAFYDEMTAQTGYADTRYLVRGRMDWEAIDRDLADPATLASQVYGNLQRMLAVRAGHAAFGRGQRQWVGDGPASNPHLLSYIRSYPGDRVLVIQNLSAEPQDQRLDSELSLVVEQETDLLGQCLEWPEPGRILRLSPYGYLWLALPT